MPPGVSLSDFYYILPELVLTGGALIVLIADVVLPKDRRAALAWVTLAALGATAASLLPFTQTHVEVAHGLLAVDQFALFFKVVFLGAAAVTVLMSIRYLATEGAASPGEYYFLILCATLGMMIMAGGIDLITIFIGLETMAVSFYILAGYIKPNQRSNEAAVKYFLLGAFSLGILLYGMSLMYGLSGTTNLRVMALRLRRAGDGSAAGARGHPCRGGHRVQDCRRAVPHVGARRVRRRADADHRVSLGGLEGRLVRDADPHLRRGDAVDERRLAAAVLRAVDSHDDGRQRRGGHAVEREADARVFVDRARRLSPDRRGRRNRARDHGDARLPDDLRVHAARRLRRHRAPAPDRRAGRRDEGLLRAGVPQPVRGLCDADLHAVARRHSPDRGLHGQVLAVQRRHRLAATTRWRSSACSTARSRSTTTSGLSCSCI